MTGFAIVTGIEMATALATTDPVIVATQAQTLYLRVIDTDRRPPRHVAVTTLTDRRCQNMRVTLATGYRAVMAIETRAKHLPVIDVADRLPREHGMARRAGVG